MDSLEVITAAGEQLRVEFTRIADRYGHTILLDGAPLLRSVEGDATHPWPPSPPLQSLSIESLPDGRRVALLVGMAGRGHWSASVETDTRRPALIFDIACRSSVQPNYLGSQYERADAQLYAQRYQFVGETAGGEAACAIDEDESGFRIMCPLATNPGRQTWRWRYRLELHPGLATSTTRQG